MNEVFIVVKDFSNKWEKGADAEVFNNEKDAQKFLDKEVETFLNENEEIKDMEVEKDVYPYSAYVSSPSSEYYMNINVFKKEVK